jgi:hypothetical protein
MHEDYAFENEHNENLKSSSEDKLSSDDLSYREECNINVVTE